MQTVGEILRNERVLKKLSLSQIEKVIKIREKFLILIEENKFDQFSSQTILKGFIKNYASYLGLNVSEIMAFYRRQSSDNSQITVKKNDILGQRFRITPRSFTYLSIATLLGLFFLFLIFQYFQFANAPYLNITNPPENLVVRTDEINVTGETDPDANLSINDQPVSLSSDGKFSVKVPLSLGLNALTIKSTNKFQKSTVKLRHLRLEGN